MHGLYYSNQLPEFDPAWGSNPWSLSYKADALTILPRTWFQATHSLLCTGWVVRFLLSRWGTLPEEFRQPRDLLEHGEQLVVHVWRSHEDQGILHWLQLHFVFHHDSQSCDSSSIRSHSKIKACNEPWEDRKSKKYEHAHLNQSSVWRKKGLTADIF